MNIKQNVIALDNSFSIDKLYNMTYDHVTIQTINEVDRLFVWTSFWQGVIGIPQVCE